MTESALLQILIQSGALGLLAVIILWTIKWGFPRFLENQNQINSRQHEKMERLFRLQENHAAQSRRAHIAQMAILLSRDPTNPLENGKQAELLAKIERIISMGD